MTRRREGAKGSGGPDPRLTTRFHSFAAARHAPIAFVLVVSRLARLRAPLQAHRAWMRAKRADDL